ncbi:acyl-CoA desaturase [Aureibacter tunicatorum]|uniref:Stearoyl-CoA desaturase (Delta-9 desaturase) n=1 Tax=Aureibacter tunicatorum TaxID=866807 RepID=A0AAE4BRT9_9BACT|nr:acyl-CoA desaturase [Aureibacter tunicatorum]MDR6237582.1 stearoyl-CoA desaturase (delta-9 desaturase) [Aureibacter tunicatorum]BDD02616.1 fatty acid desaturase [Aureibacter tunicatorum]
MTACIVFFILHWYSSLFFQTFFLHRYAAHAAFTMSKPMEKLFFVLTWLFQGSNYLSAYGYGVMHRMHHAFADTEKDPHSPKYDESLFKMMWRTKTIYSDITNGTYKEPIDETFTKGVPKWDAFDKLARSRVSRILWGILYVAFYYHYATEWWLYLLLPIHFLMSPIHGAIINWFAHIYGYTNHKVNDTSKNLLPFDFLMMGESYHNNHHHNGSKANFGEKWHEVDPTYIFIWIFDKIGIIKLRRAKGIKVNKLDKQAA